MLIDWFTVGAQTLNFLILVWLMKRFLYKPVIDAIDARESRIASALADATQKQAQADKQRDEFEQKNAEFDQQREAIARQASEKLDAQRQHLLAQAHAAADAMRDKRHADLTSELQTLQQDIAQRSQAEVFAVARKVLTDLSGIALEDRITEVFAQQLRAMEAPARNELSNALQASPATVRVRSAFELTPEQQTSIGQALDAAMQAKLSLQFETSPEVISGIELSANGWKVAWNIADYMAQLQQHIGEPVKPVKASAPATP